MVQKPLSSPREWAHQESTSTQLNQHHFRRSPHAQGQAHHPKPRLVIKVVDPSSPAARGAQGLDPARMAGQSDGHGNDHSRPQGNLHAPGMAPCLDCGTGRPPDQRAPGPPARPRCPATYPLQDPRCLSPPGAAPPDAGPCCAETPTSAGKTLLDLALTPTPVVVVAEHRQGPQRHLGQGAMTSARPLYAVS